MIIFASFNILKDRIEQVNKMKINKLAIGIHQQIEKNMYNDTLYIYIIIHFIYKQNCEYLVYNNYVILILQNFYSTNILKRN